MDDKTTLENKFTKALNQLKESEELYKELVEKAGIGILIDDREGHIQFANERAAEIYGYSFNELKKQTLQSLVHPDDRKRVEANHRARISGRPVPQTYEFRGIKRDGTERNIELNASPKKEGKKIVGTRIYIKDITERKKAEDKLRFSNAAFQSIQESIIATDLEFTITYWNEASERIYGIKASEALGNKFTDILEITETYAGESEERIKTLEAEGCFQEEQLHKTKQSIVWVNVSYQEILGEGKRTGWVVLATDISRRKITEKNLRENEEFLISILESMDDGVMALNRDFQYTYWNNGMEQISKTSRDELLYSEKLPWELFPFLAETGVDNMMKAAMKGETVQKVELPYRLKDGTKGITSEMFLPLKSASGQIRGVIGVVKDTTERIKVELALKKSEKNLRNLARHMELVRENERTSIAREIHDELGQSLTALKMDIYWLQKKFAHTDNELKKKTDSMIGLTDQTIQTVKKISSELRPGLLDDLGLIPAIEWQAEEFQKRFGIKCDLQIESEDIPIDLQGSTALFRIFQETLTNVARHSQATKLKVSLVEKNGQIEMTIKDNGIGINADQISNPKSFGLMGIKERILALGGESLIQGTKDKGTIVTVHIPIVKKEK